MIAFTLVCMVIGAAAAIYLARPLLQETGSARLIGVAAGGLLAAGALAAYWVNGMPEAPGAPYQPRMDALRAADPETLTPVEQEEWLRDAVRRDARDVEARRLLGRFLATTGRELEAIAHLEQALRISPEARILNDLGQTIVTLNQGTVTPEAARAFSAAHAEDPAMPEPAFFLGAAAYEAGDRETAAAYWGGIITRLGEDDPYRDAIASRAADLLSRPSMGGADPAEITEGAEPPDVEAMIAGMIIRLETRLETDPDDVSGWLTLARARMMQEDREAAARALSRGRAAFADDPGARALISALSAAFGLEETDA
jgi:cytochrome c-type biogenesis protein CcmH